MKMQQAIAWRILHPVRFLEMVIFPHLFSMKVEILPPLRDTIICETGSLRFSGMKVRKYLQMDFWSIFDQFLFRKPPFQTFLDQYPTRRHHRDLCQSHPWSLEKTFPSKLRIYLTCLLTMPFAERLFQTKRRLRIGCHLTRTVKQSLKIEIISLHQSQRMVPRWWLLWGPKDPTVERIFHQVLFHLLLLVLNLSPECFLHLYNKDNQCPPHSLAWTKFLSFQCPYIRLLTSCNIISTNSPR